MGMSDALMQTARKAFHAELLRSAITTHRAVPSIADKDNRTSILYAKAMLEKIGEPREIEKQAAQTVGDDFEKACATFLKVTFPMLKNLRPGKWMIERVGRGGGGIAKFDQYSHLKDLADMCRTSGTLSISLGRDYLIIPDVIIFRDPVPDLDINAGQLLVDDQVARFTPLREVNSSNPILHASVSCKLTLRSDRAQNARSEALNLIKNRKGRLPHIVVVTAEPLPSRLASLAMGTGELDCVYHIALPELMDAIRAEQNSGDSLELLRIMVEGKRLRDIADLPLDLAI